jgi:hypothetical protein
MKQLVSLEMLAKKPYLLWNNLTKTDSCWFWNKSVNQSGYGSIRIGPTSVLTHRAAFVLAGNSLFLNKCVCHTCDQPSCCNPSHLFQADHKSNMADMKIKGRRKKIGCGETNGRAKLTQLIAENIRQKRASGMTLKELSFEFNVSKSTISRVCRMENWS